jgi:DNA polymerase-3 subunit delta
MRENHWIYYMKFYSNQVTDVASGIEKATIAATLLYGPDRGLIDYSASHITKILNLPKRTISYADIVFDELKSELNNISLFGTKEIIHLTNISTFDAKLKDLVKAENHHILIITADELTPSSALRKTFETEKNLAAIACYHDDATSVEKLARKYCADAQKRISADALKYLSHSLYGDRYIIINEIEKLLIYASDKEEITIEDVIAVISGSTTPEPDMLCIYFFKNDKKLYLEELNKLLDENISAVWIVRALIRYSINVYITLQKMSEGADLDEAAGSITPPIFFKNMPDFKRIVGKFDTTKILRLMERLYKAEVGLKSSGIGERFVCEGLLM